MNATEFLEQMRADPASRPIPHEAPSPRCRATCGHRSGSDGPNQRSLIGEAAAAVSAELRVDYPEVPWRDLVGMRNILVHAYRRVNVDLLWRAVERLPEIEAQILAILAAEEWPK
jgi:hypothetical protein